MPHRKRMQKRNKERDKIGKHGVMDSPIVKLPWETGDLLQDILNADPGKYDNQKRRSRNKRLGNQY